MLSFYGCGREATIGGVFEWMQDVSLCIETVSTCTLCRYGFLTGRLAGDGEESGDAERGPARDGVDVHPEGDPRDNHDQDGGDVRLDHVEPHRTTQVKLGHQAAVITCKKNE